MAERLDPITNKIHCRDEEALERTWNMYQRLQQLNRMGHPEKTHLQQVERLDQDGLDITVQLSPLGYHREPCTAAEVRTWLKNMLTALELWHAHNYCHGDVCWENIVYVPGAEGYWVLTNLDGSSRRDHPSSPESQVDLVQLGALLSGLLERQGADTDEKLLQLGDLRQALVGARLTGYTAMMALQDMALNA